MSVTTIVAFCIKFVNISTSMLRVCNTCAINMLMTNPLDLFPDPGDDFYPVYGRFNLREPEPGSDPLDTYSVPERAGIDPGLTDEHHFDPEVFSARAIDQLRQSQIEPAMQAAGDKVQALRPEDNIFVQGPLARIAGRQEAVQRSIEEYIDNHVPASLLGARPYLRDELIDFLSHYSITSMSETEWQRGQAEEDADSIYQQMPGKDRIAVDLASIIGEQDLDQYLDQSEDDEGPEDDDEEPPDDDEPGHDDDPEDDEDDLDDEEDKETDDTRLNPLNRLLLAGMNARGSAREHLGRHRGKYALGALAVVGAGVAAYFLHRYGVLLPSGSGHGIASNLPATGPGKSGIISPPAQAPGAPGSSGLHAHEAAGAKILNAHQTGGIERQWASGSGPNHMTYFIDDKKGGGMTIEVKSLHAGGMTVDGHLVNLSKAHNLRANIMLNVNGKHETISVPMDGDKLHIPREFAKLLRRRDFSYVEIVRTVGQSGGHIKEQVFSTVVGNDRSLSVKHFHRYAIEAHKLLGSHQGGGGQTKPQPGTGTHGTLVSKPLTSQGAAHPAPGRHATPVLVDTTMPSRGGPLVPVNRNTAPSTLAATPNLPHILGENRWLLRTDLAIGGAALGGIGLITNERRLKSGSSSKARHRKGRSTPHSRRSGTTRVPLSTFFEP